MVHIYPYLQNYEYYDKKDQFQNRNSKTRLMELIKKLIYAKVSKKVFNQSINIKTKSALS